MDAVIVIERHCGSANCMKLFFSNDRRVRYVDRWIRGVTCPHCGSFNMTSHRG